MRSQVAAGLLAAALLRPSFAGAEEFTPGDYALAGVGVALLAADYAQTRQIVRACDEMNPIITRCGPVSRAGAYMASAAAVYLVGAYALRDHPRARRIWLGSWVAVELGAVSRNVTLGYAARW